MGHMALAAASLHPRSEQEQLEAVGLCLQLACEHQARLMPKRCSFGPVGPQATLNKHLSFAFRIINPGWAL